MIRQEYFDRLKKLLIDHSVRTGDFVLASGKRSNIYVDCRLTTCRADAMPLIGRTMLERMRERGWRPYAVGGLTMGADPVVAAIARESLEYGKLIHSFLIRKEAKKHGRQQFLEGIAEPAGRDVVIIDDVCTTGGSTIMAIDRARQAGMNVLGALCIVDREEGGRENIEQGSNCPFERVFTMKELLAAKESASVPSS